MFLVSLHLQNFRQHRDTYIQFGQGLTGILGDNGAGKSTILEAIAWAFYGNKPGVLRGSKDTLIWRYAPGKAEVVVDLEFIWQQHSYRIQRSQGNRSEAQLWQEGQLIATSVKGVDEKLEQLLRMNYQEFFNSYFTGQKELQFLGAIEGGANRERFIARMLGYERIEEVQGKADKPNTLRYDIKQTERQKDNIEGQLQALAGLEERLQRQQQQLATATAELQAVQQQLTEITKQREQEQKRWQEINDRRTHFLQLQHKLETNQQRAQQLTAEIEQLQADRHKLETELEQFSQLQSLALHYQDMQTEYQTLQSQYESFLRARQTKEKYQKLQQEITEITAEIELLLPIELELQNLTAELTNYQQQIDHLAVQINAAILEWQQQQADLQAQIKTEKQTLERFKKQQQTILAAGAEGICPTCERPLREEYETVIHHFARHIQECEQHLQTWQQQLRKLQVKPEPILALETARSDLQSQLQAGQNRQKSLAQDLSKREILHKQLAQKQKELQELGQQQEPVTFDPDHYQFVQEQLQQLRPQYETFLKLSQTPGHFRKVVEQLEQKQGDWQTVLQEIEQLQQQVTSLDYREAEFRQRQQQFQATEDLYQKLNTQYQTTQERLHLYQQQLQELQQQQTEYQRLQEQRKVIGIEYFTLKELDQAFTELREYLTKQIRPRLAETASYFLQQLTDGRYDGLELDDKYQVIVKSQGESKPVISGGEEDIVNLCLRLAISQMITERTGQPFSLLILDEVFGSLDQNRRENVLQLLYGLEQQFEQVLIITHIEDIKESLHQTIRLAFDPIRQYTVLVNQ
ncbi:MAG: SMC family ATPase [Pseudanabaenaceae cyanobacterium SKYGB_i_bin29]|nr:SMC family ATPase [Pseudanabaenaceae cyanobacterium SKYG29]MDW8421241.1 SMC family ATPase [Pseudanabaenaceae cyanobacterium SKYGB_i_bin29]